MVNPQEYLLWTWRVGHRHGKMKLLKANTRISKLGTCVYMFWCVNGLYFTNIFGLHQVDRFSQQLQCNPLGQLSKLFTKSVCCCHWQTEVVKLSYSKLLSVLVTTHLMRDSRASLDLSEIYLSGTRRIQFFRQKGPHTRRYVHFGKKTFFRMKEWIIWTSKHVNMRPIVPFELTRAAKALKCYSPHQQSNNVSLTGACSTRTFTADICLIC